ncbi:MAG: glycoside hydrolase family 92 protein, partial [Muribaculaceae bacterium]|nr:glycoside hydrolase family 92 protein [Muribaculaceae bacterium]
GQNYTIIAHGAYYEHVYIDRMLLNGRPYDKTVISHDDIMAGSTLECFMTSSPD